MKLAKPTSLRGDGAAQHGYVQNDTTQISALQCNIVFDYEDLTMANESDSTKQRQITGDQRHTEKSIHTPRRQLCIANQQQPLIRQPTIVMTIGPVRDLFRGQSHCIKEKLLNTISTNRLSSGNPLVRPGRCLW